MIDKLLKEIGKPYEMFSEDGNYLGCFYPIYFVYPDLPRYPLPSDDNKKNFKYGMVRILKNAYEISEKELSKGDVIACEYNGELHVALYLGKGKIIHVFRHHTLQTNKLKILKDYKCFRVKND